MSLRFHPPQFRLSIVALANAVRLRRLLLRLRKRTFGRVVDRCLLGWTLLQQLATVVRSQEAIMAGDYHVRAAEMHEMAAHAHRAASAGHGKQDHLSGHEQAQRAMEYAVKDVKQSQEALKQSAMYAKPPKNKQR